MYVWLIVAHITLPHGYGEVDSLLPMGRVRAYTTEQACKDVLSGYNMKQEAKPVCVPIMLERGYP